jgi:hypothetical protein
MIMVNRPAKILSGVVAAAMLAMSSCSKVVAPQSIISKGARIEQEHFGHDSLEIITTGTAGFIIRYKESVLIADPFIGNPSMSKVVSGKIAPDTLYAKSIYDKELLAKAKVIIIGHGHYDHVLDLPAISDELDRGVKVFCNKSVANILAATSLRSNVVNVESVSGTYSREGEWQYSADSSIRIMAFKSTHPPHFLGITLYSGDVAAPLSKLPVKANGWKMGLPLTFLADFMEHGKPVYRIYAQSSACSDSVGLFPAAMMQEKPVDIAFTAAASSRKRLAQLVKTVGYADPEVEMITHWDNFFERIALGQDVKAMAKCDVAGNYYALQKAYGSRMKVILPRQGSRFIIAGK